MEQATGAEVVALVQEDRLARSEEAVFQWVVVEAGAVRSRAACGAEARAPAAMAAGFLRETVVAWPALQSVEGQRMVLAAMLPLADGTKAVPRSGFGPRLIYLVGGEDEDEVTISSVDYDPQAASWTQLPA